MADISYTEKKVKPLPGHVRRDFIAGGSGKVGDLVYVDSNGKVQVTDADAAGTTKHIGIVVSAGSFGATTFADGDAVSVVTLGPVAGYASMTPGASHYVSNTAGAISTTAGTTSRLCGIALSAEIFFVIPMA